MTFATFAIKSAFRNRLRTSLTTLGVAVAVLAFLFLRAIIASYSAGANASSSDRMVTRNKISITFPLPLAYGNKLKAIPGVSAVASSNWFGGIYKDRRNFFAQFAVDDVYLDVYPEFVIGDAEKKAWMADRSGCIVGQGLAEKYGWKVGDTVPLKGDIYPGDWKFTIRGIYGGRDQGTPRQMMFFHWKYLNEAVDERRRDQVGIFVMRIPDASRSKEVAREADALFANSAAETRTETEVAFQLAFLSMAGAVITAIQMVSGVMMAILMLILGNTMAMSTRERTNEYAVMRSIGFAPRHIMLLVFGEGLIVALLGFAVGAGLAAPLLKAFAKAGSSQFGNFLMNFGVNSSSLAMAAAAAVFGGLLATGVPAIRASRLSIVDALRRVE